MKHERTVRECTFQASDTAPPCVVLIDPDPLSPKRFSHTARWTWSDEEALFLASLVLRTLAQDMEAATRLRISPTTIATLIAAQRIIDARIDPNENSVTTVARKKRLTPKRKGA